MFDKEVAAPFAVEAFEGAVDGAEDGESVDFLEVRQGAGAQGEDGGAGFAGEDDVDEAAEWRIVGLHALGFASLVEGEEVVGLGAENGLGVGIEGLDDDLAGFGSASGAAGHLAEELEGALG